MPRKVDEAQRPMRANNEEFKDEESPKDHDASSTGFTVATGPLDAHSGPMVVEDPIQRKRVHYTVGHLESEPAERRPCCLNSIKGGMVGIVLLLGTLFILLLVFMLSRGKADKESTVIIVAEPPESRLDPDWVTSVLTRKTTPFDPISDPSNCDFTGVTQPNVALQCECGDTIDVVAKDILDLYDEFRVTLIPAIYGGDWTDVPPNSCDPRNQALLWLASGNTRENSNNLIQRYILALLYSSWMGPQWDESTGWWTDRSECEWMFATCNTQDGQVVSLGFPANNIAGTIPKEIYHLKDLKELSVTENYLEGTIPSTLMQVTTLQKLALFHNAITGSVPTEIATLSNLLELRLEHNELSGSLATEVGLVTSLQVINLGFNTIDYNLPSEIGSLSNLRSLALEDNFFSGSMPTDFGRLPLLESLSFNNNRLTGAIPSEYGSMTSMTHFLAFENDLTGTIPAEFAGMAQLEVLDLYQTRLTGDIPVEICGIKDVFVFVSCDDTTDGSGINCPSDCCDCKE